MSYPEPGLGHVGAYQVSGFPFLTGSSLAPGAQTCIVFPCVTRRIYAKKISANGTVYIHFADDVADPNVTLNHHYIRLNSEDEAIDMFVKASKVYLSNPSLSDPVEFELLAELTNIPAARMPPLTGPGIDE